jgi:hypothetical protein
VIAFSIRFVFDFYPFSPFRFGLRVSFRFARFVSVCAFRFVSFRHVSFCFLKISFRFILFFDFVIVFSFRFVSGSSWGSISDH